MWVAIDCRSKNWVAVLKSSGSTDLAHAQFCVTAPVARQRSCTYKFPTCLVKHK
jgi:hypothetical protein